MPEREVYGVPVETRNKGKEPRDSVAITHFWFDACSPPVLSNITKVHLCKPYSFSKSHFLVSSKDTDFYPKYVIKKCDKRF